MTNEPVIMLRWALGEAGLSGVVGQAPQRAVRLLMDSDAAADLAALLGIDPRAIGEDLRAIHRIRARTVEEAPGSTKMILPDAQALRLADLIASTTVNASS